MSWVIMTFFDLKTHEYGGTSVYLNEFNKAYILRKYFPLIIPDTILSIHMRVCTKFRLLKYYG